MKKNRCMCVMSACVMTITFIICYRGARKSPAFKWTKSKQSTYVINAFLGLRGGSQSYYEQAECSSADKHFKEDKNIPPVLDGCGRIVVSYLPPRLFYILSLVELNWKANRVITFLAHVGRWYEKRKKTALSSSLFLLCCHSRWFHQGGSRDALECSSSPSLHNICLSCCC